MGEVCQEVNSKSCLSVIWRVCNFFMSLFFALATYVQINDPDAGLWMVRVQVFRTLFCLWAFLYVICYFHDVSVADWLWCSCSPVCINWLDTPFDREFSGLMLTIVWLLMCRHSGRAPVGMLRVSTAVAITVFPFVAWLYYYINKELTSNWPSHCKTAI
uniref:Transmembrane protein 220 n=1 Tax=Sander lucioperca TaxID=283035 RepID=A0A8C9XU64_SANLU